MQEIPRRLTVATLMIGVILSGHSVPVRAADPLIGTWKFNAAKSSFSLGPPPKSLMVKFEAVGEGVRSIVDGLAADGSPIHQEYTAEYDGKDYPITGSAADAVSLRRIDANTTERTDKKGGKVLQTLTREVSSDGKTMTITARGAQVQGQPPVGNVAVFDKQ